MIAIIDYGAGNLRSVAKAFERLGHKVKVTNEARDILDAPAIVLPGVGAASNTMNSLAALGLVDPIREVIAADKPFFGVCLGLQVLLDGSEEGGWQDCLGVIPGTVKRLSPALNANTKLKLKVPHMGWNSVKYTAQSPLFEGIPDESYFYFVHSYYVEPRDPDVVASVTDYGRDFCSAIVRGNLVATQFHPEKSGKLGLKLYDNFARLALRQPVL